MRGPAIVCAAVLGLWCNPGAAAQTVYAPGDGSPNSITLTVPVSASINSHCGFATGGAPSGTYNQPNFDTNGLSHDVPFTLDCNLPMRVGVVSSNGGLLASTGSLPAGYAAFAPYSVTLNLVGDATSASATCTASTLTSGSSCSS